MTRLQKLRRPLAAGLLSFILFQTSAQNAVAVGAYQTASRDVYSGTSATPQSQMLPWTAAALAAAGLVGGAIAAYELGTIIGNAVHDAIGVVEQPTFVAYEKLAYVADDFSQFDTTK